MCRDCGDPKSQHKGGTGGCRHCELGCARFVPETPQDLTGLEQDLAELEATDPAVAEAAKQLDETTSAIVSASEQLRTTRASLARVERERDEARAAVADVEQHRKLAAERLTRVETELRLAEASLKAMADDLRAAQEEAHTLRNSEDLEVATLRGQLADQGEVLTQYVAHQCLTCAARYIPDTAAAAGHDHPVTRVRVTVTRLGGAS